MRPEPQRRHRRPAPLLNPRAHRHEPPRTALHALAPRQHGVSVLLEALIAILIFRFGILGLVGLQAGMVKGTSEAKYRAEASYVAQREIGRIADPNNAANYLQNGTDISGSSGLPGGTLSIVQPAAGSAYVVTVAWQQPGEAPHSLVTWVSTSRDSEAMKNAPPRLPERLEPYRTGWWRW